MKNLSNLLAVLLFVVMLGVLAGCGCGTTDTPPANDMVNDTNQQNTNDTTVETRPDDGIIQDTTPNTIIDGEPNYGNNNITNSDMVNPTTDYYNTVSDNNVTNDTHNGVGNVVDDAGNIVGDVVDDAGRAISDVGNGVRNMTNDMTR